jgi:hypothetical protein
MLSDEERISTLSKEERRKLAEKAVEAIIGKSRGRNALAEELAEIESDLVRQLVQVYRRGTSYDEFCELVENLRSFSDMRKNFAEQ